jgi:Multi-copper polyphenol oxidoreductase laccase
MPNPLQASNLAKLPGIRHGFFGKSGGVSKGIYASLNCGSGSFDDPAAVIENRRRVAHHLGADHGAVVTLYQCHGATALTVTGPVARDGLPKADAVVSRTPGLAIGVLTADCTPVLFADPDAKVVAAAHAGWRGAVGGILEAAIAEMERQGARPNRIVAAIGSRPIQRGLFPPGRAKRREPKTPFRLSRLCGPPLGPRRPQIDREPMPLYLHERITFLQLPALATPQRAGLRPPNLRHCRGLTAQSTVIFAFRCLNNGLTTV